MDLSLKQRLLGAAVLIALAVIFIPMFLSEPAPDRPAGRELGELAIPPAPDAEFQTRVLPVAPADAPIGEAETGERLATVDTATAPPPEIATPVEEPAPAPATAPRVDTPAQAPTPAPVPADRQAAKPDTSADRTPAPAAGRAGSSGHYLHLGVYANAGNANELVASLKKAGFAAFGEPVEYQGKPATRVRVGPFANRAGADAARLRVRELKPDVPGSVVQVTADAKADAPAGAVPAGRAGGFAVQLAALKTEAEANKLRDRARQAGYAAYVDQVQSGGATLWRVRIGPEVDRAAAERLRAGVRDKLKLDGILVTL